MLGRQSAGHRSWISRLLVWALRAYPSNLRSQLGAELAETAVLRVLARRRQGRAAAFLWLAHEVVGLLTVGLLSRVRAAIPSTRSAWRNRRSDRRSDRMDILFYMVRHAIRALCRQPGFSLAAVLTLALGLGSSVAIFSVVQSVVLRPLPFADTERLALLFETNPERGWQRAQVAAANYVDWRDQARSFVDIGAYNDWLEEMAMIVEGEPVAIYGHEITGNLFAVLGTEAALGRTFDTESTWANGSGEEPVVLLSHQFWSAHLGSDPNIVGKVLDIDSRSRRVVGVMPRGFQQPLKSVDVWVPMAWDPAFQQQTWFRRAHGLRAIGRLRKDVDPAAAENELATIAQRLEQEYPETNTDMGNGLMTLRDYLLGDTKQPLLVLAVAVVLLLLISAANVANLLLMRATARRNEVATQRALGASRARMMSQGLAESLLLALCGCAAGGAIGLWAVRLLVQLQPDVLPRLDGVGLNLSALGFALALSIVIAGLCGVMPAWKASAATCLRPPTRRLWSGLAALVVLEVSLTLPLAVAAGLMARSLWQMHDVDPGFSAKSTLVASLSLPQTRYDDRQKVADFYAQILDAVQVLPGVRSVALSSRLPFGNQRWSSDFSAQTWSEGRYGVGVRHDEVSPGLFSTLSVPLIAGRDFHRQETEGVVIVNQALVERYFSNTDPLGVRVTFDREPGPNAYWRTIVGVVGNVRRETLALEEEPSFYAPILQDTTGTAHLLVKTEVDPPLLLGTIEEAVHAIDPAMPLSGVTTLADQLAEASARERFVLLLLAAFAVIAIALASLGVFSVVASATQRRTREIGIRMALGAGRKRVASAVLRRGLLPVALGCAIGLVAAMFVCQSLEELLFEVDPLDPGIFALVAVIVLLIGLLACLVPAARATRIQAASILRHD